MAKARSFEFTTRIKKHAISTWRILIPIKAIRKLDLRKKVKVTLSQEAEDLE